MITIDFRAKCGLVPLCSNYNMKEEIHLNGNDTGLTCSIWEKIKKLQSKVAVTDKFIFYFFLHSAKQRFI